MEQDDTLPVALARLEGKVDALLASLNLLNVSIHDLDTRVREVEREVAALKQQQVDVTAPKVAWPVVAGALAAAATLVWLVFKEIFHVG